MSNFDLGASWQSVWDSQRLHGLDDEPRSFEVRKGGMDTFK